jgi:hypothetical protein
MQSAADLKMWGVDWRAGRGIKKLLPPIEKSKSANLRGFELSPDSSPSPMTAA